MKIQSRHLKVGLYRFRFQTDIWREACKDWNSKKTFGEKHVRVGIPTVNGCMESSLQGLGFQTDILNEACKDWDSKQTFGEKHVRIGILNRHLMRSI